MTPTETKHRPSECEFCQAEIHPFHAVVGWKYVCSKTCFDLYLSMMLLLGYHTQPHIGVRIRPQSPTKLCTVHGVIFRQDAGWYEIRNPRLLDKLQTVRDRCGRTFDVQLNPEGIVGLYKEGEKFTLCIQ